ncbi:MAG: hypothetical protein QM719_03010 [Thermomonas sp.]
MPLVILLEEPRLSWIRNVLALLLLACLIVSAVHQIRKGGLYQVAAGRKRRERWILAAFLLSPIIILAMLRIFH